MTVSVVTKSAGAFGVWAVLVTPSGKAVHNTAIYSASNWAGAIAVAKAHAKAKGWTVAA